MIYIYIYTCTDVYARLIHASSRCDFSGRSRSLAAPTHHGLRALAPHRSLGPGRLCVGTERDRYVKGDLDRGVNGIHVERERAPGTCRRG